MRRALATAAIAFLISTAAFGQELDPATRWATIAFNEFHLAQNIVYQRSNNVSLKLDVITAGPMSVARPTVTI